VNDSTDNSTMTFAWRYWVLLGGFVLCAVALFYRAVDLHVYEQAFLAEQGDARSIRFETLDAHRGVITDRHGEPLAVSAPVETVYADPRYVTLTLSQTKALAQALGVSSAWLTKKIERNHRKHFVYLKRKMAPHEVKKVLALNFDGIYSRREYKRYYPAGEVAAHVVGFTNIDKHGQEGIELSYDEWLSGESGKKRVLKDRTARVIKDFGPVKIAQPGKDIQLTLDMRIQYLAYRELKAAVETHHAKAGSIVVLDIHTGDVLAMANQPSYNPNNRTNINVAHLRNRAITDVFEPGSTMKLATISAALESKKYTLNTRLDTSPGYIRLGRKSIRDHRNYGELSVLNIIAKSSNVGTSKIALDLTGDVVWDMFSRLGFGQGTGIGFPGESIGHLPDSSHWQPIEVAAMSYGYGLNATALQLAQAYMVLGNGGIKHPLGLVYRDDHLPGERIVSASVSESLKRAMKAVVSKGGTGTRAQLPLYDVGGKTGTVHSVGRSGYEHSRYKALFAGIAPLDDPKIAMVVVIDEPAGAEYYGGEVAAPVFSRVVNGAMRLLNVSPDKGLAESLAQNHAVATRG
jgi:cell division protein FtsI (penicillin-binding protein 3)